MPIDCDHDLSSAVYTCYPQKMFWNNRNESMGALGPTPEPSNCDQLNQRNFSCNLMNMQCPLASGSPFDFDTGSAIFKGAFGTRATITKRLVSGSGIVK